MVDEEVTKVLHDQQLTDLAETFESKFVLYIFMTEASGRLE